jgi:hypothetical protein
MTARTGRGETAAALSCDDFLITGLIKRPEGTIAA